MIILTIIVFLCLACLVWAVAHYIAEGTSKNPARALMMMPMIIILVCTILAHLSVIELHKELEKEKQSKPQYKEITKTLYEKIE